MRRLVRVRSVLIASLVAAAGFLVAGGPPAVAASAPVGSWGTAIKAPGTSTASGADVAGVSCAPHGDCTALVDTGLDTVDHVAGYAITEHGGVWGPRVLIPGLTRIAPAGLTAVVGLSCPRSGYCLVIGVYAYGAGDNSVGGFTIWESGGKWLAPAKIGGLAKLATAGQGFPTQVACASTSSCVVSGMYGTGSSKNPATSVFMAEELRGTWKPAIQVPGLPAPSTGAPVLPAALSCPSVGNCVIGMGFIGIASGLGIRGTGAAASAVLGTRGASRPFITGSPSAPARAAVETGGTWHKAQVVGPSVGTSGLAAVNALACPAAGKCVLGGYTVTATASGGESFVTTQSGTAWSKPVKFPGTSIVALACPAAGDCVAGGQDAKNVAAILREQGGVWGAPRELPGATALSHGTAKAQQSQVDYLGCPSAGNCGLVGSYEWEVNSTTWGQAPFVGGESNGSWARVRVPAGIAALNTGLSASFTGLACSSAANCAAGGAYSVPGIGMGAFLITETPAP
jgi:hypothetical protein